MSILNRLFINNLRSKLAAAITDSATTIDIVDGSGFILPSGKHIIATLTEAANLEIVKITAAAANQLTVQRGQEGTTAQAFSAAAMLSVNLTADTLNQLVAQLLLLGAVPPSVEEWGLMSGLSYDDLSLELVYQDSLAFDPTGTKLYVSDYYNINTYNLTVAWDISTATYASNYAAGGGIRGFTLSDSGTRLFIAYQDGPDSLIKAYTLSVAWDMSSLAYDASSPDLASIFEGSSYRKVRVSSDGFDFFVLSDGEDAIIKLSASLAFDVTTISTTEVNRLQLPANTDLRGLAIHPNLDRLLIASNDDHAIQNYALSSAGNLSTGSLDGEFIPMQSVLIGFSDIYIGGNGQYLYVLRAAEDPDWVARLYRYSW